MKKRYLMLIMAALLMITTLLAACGSDDVEEEGTDDNNVEEEVVDEGEEEADADAEVEDEVATGDLEGTVTVSGSTSVQPVSEELAAAFMEINPDVRVEVAGGGSGAGVTAAQELAADFGAASREIKEEETGVDEYVIAIDGIAIISHPDNTVAEITLEDATKIFKGEITNWSEVGGEDQDIVVVSREDGSGTRGAFTELVLEDDETALVDSALIHNSTGGVLEAVASDPFAIGYASTGSMTDAVKGLLVDGAEPTEEAITAGDYPISRPFNYVSNSEAGLTDVAQAFLDFVLSEEGQAVVTESGFIPVN